MRPRVELSCRVSDMKDLVEPEEALGPRTGVSAQRFRSNPAITKSASPITPRTTFHVLMPPIVGFNDQDGSDQPRPGFRATCAPAPEARFSAYHQHLERRTVPDGQTNSSVRENHDPSFDHSTVRARAVLVPQNGQGDDFRIAAPAGRTQRVRAGPTASRCTPMPARTRSTTCSKAAGASCSKAASSR